jgi:hypothetical protein
MLDPINWMVRVPAKLLDTEFWRHASLFQFIYSVLGLVFGFACIICGVVLFLHGVAGSSSWTMKILGSKSQISDAAPGAILFLVGLFIVYVTRFGVRSTK